MAPLHGPCTHFSRTTDLADQQLIFLRLKLKRPLTALAVAPSTTAIALANSGCLTAEGAVCLATPIWEPQTRCQA